MAVSVIIPTTSAWEHLWRLRLVLESLCHQTEQPREIMVVDAEGCSNDVEYVCREFLHRRLPINWTSIDNANKQFKAGAARNHGVRRLTYTANTDRLLFVDTDCVLSPNLIKVHSEFHQSYLVAGARAHVNPEDLISEEFKLEAVYNAPTKPDKRMEHPENWDSYECCYTCQLSISWRTFHRIGGFWERVVFGEDREMAMRAERAGDQIVFLPEHLVYHIDHPIWRPTSKEELEPGDMMCSDSCQIPGFHRD